MTCSLVYGDYRGWKCLSFTPAIIVNAHLLEPLMPCVGTEAADIVRRQHLFHFL